MSFVSLQLPTLLDLNDNYNGGDDDDDDNNDDNNDDDDDNDDDESIPITIIITKY